jgi:hypothetical protein
MYIKRAQRVDDMKIGLQNLDLYKTCVSFVPGGPMENRIVRDYIKFVTEKTFEILCEQNHRKVYERLRENEDEYNDDVLEQDILD